MHVCFFCSNFDTKISSRRYEIPYILNGHTECKTSAKQAGNRWLLSVKAEGSFRTFHPSIYF